MTRPQPRSAHPATQANRRNPSRLARLLSDVGAYRWQLRLNQSEFWTRYGATQSGGSRYEKGRQPHRAVQLLFALEEMGAVDAEILARAHARLERARRQLGWSET